MRGSYSSRAEASDEEGHFVSPIAIFYILALSVWLEVQVAFLYLHIPFAEAFHLRSGEAVERLHLPATGGR